MSSVKKLAGQTLWYGIPTIASRFLGYLMNMALPFIFKQPEKTADLTQVYAIVPFLTILFTYGMETAFFRFYADKDKTSLFSTLSISVIVSTILFSLGLYFLSPFIVSAAGLQEHPEYITWMIVILFFDTLSTLPFAVLRQENRPRKYAFVRIAGIVINILAVILCLGILPSYVLHHPQSFIASIFNEKIGIGYYIIGNMCGAFVTWLLLWSEWKQVKLKFDFGLWKEVMKYSYPLIIVGLGGMINDMLSRLVYQHVVDVPQEQAKHELGVFANIYRIAVLITIMIQAFRMAAEPFFFKQAKEENAQKTYARVMKFFVLACCFMFLGIGLYLDVLKWIITLKSKSWGEGMNVVLLLAMGNIFLGIYYNLSIWYRLTNKNLYGAAITIGGAVITIVINILLIPKFHYLGAAIATFTCYLFMMIASYILGQKYYPVPYARKKLIAYLVMVVLIVLAQRVVVSFYSPLWFSVLSGTALFAMFAYFVMRVERKELQRLPFIGKYISGH
ncbi:MAG: oligosaccharide flippase family protein [Chitinophagaceae bacterium]|nr:oligosaccharide flippase family protein [Chitinophagaceae bacterium]